MVILFFLLLSALVIVRLSLVLCLDCFFLFMCVSIIVFSLCSPLYLDMTIYVLTELVGVVILLFSNAFSMFCICLLLFLCLLVLMTYLSVDDFLPLYYSCRAGFEVLNSFSFCLSEKLLISSSNLNESLAGYSILGSRFLPFITLNILPLSFHLPTLC